MIDKSLRLTTDSEDLNSGSSNASLMISGRRDWMTLAMIESETRSTASSMFSRAMFRATLIRSSLFSIRIKKPLSARVTSITSSIKLSSNRSRS